jgi:predicted Zn-dependent peptidase
MDLQAYQLSNGIRLVHRSVPGNISHCGIFINAGTRDEGNDEQGMAHFIEHVIFKGTESRNVYQVLNRLENVGADLNAYTTKEETCIYASFLNPYYGRTLELISDICFHSTFPQKELDKEKEVIIDEIKSYLDNPSDQIFDDFEDLVFDGHPLGRNILGTPRNVRKFKTADVREFIRRNYNTDQVVISSVGNIGFQKLIRLVENYFSGVAVNRRIHGRKPFIGYVSKQVSRKKKTFQTHCIIGATGYSMESEKRYTLAFLNNILGGPVLNSRLSIALRERNGLTYQIESNYMPYTDTGIVSIYFGTDRTLLEKAYNLVMKEVARLRTEKLSKFQLLTAKKQLIGQLSIAQESRLNQMFAMGKSYLVMNEYLPLEEIIPKIEAITSDSILETANEIFAPERLSHLIFNSTNNSQ